MSRKDNKRKGATNNTMLPVMRADAAGIDIGETEIFVAVPADRGQRRISAAFRLSPKTCTP